MATPMGQTLAPLVLASASPRRKAMLEELGLTFTVAPADVDEAVHPGEAPRDYVRRVARHKARVISEGQPGAFVLAADTTVVVDGEILGKPNDAQEALSMLRRLSGRAHEVLTAVAVGGPSGVRDAVVRSLVHFRALGDSELAWYAGTREPLDKAGGYGLQGKAGMFVSKVEGSVSSVIGLPLAETVALLEEAGCRLPWSAAGVAEEGRSS